MRPYPPDTAPMPASTVAPPATLHEGAARALLALAKAQDEREPPVRLGVLRGEAARAVARLNGDLLDESVRVEAAVQHHALAHAEPIPSATLRAWAAGWRALAGSL